MQLSNSRLFFEIDDEDFDLVKKYRWLLNQQNYIVTYINGEYIKYHRMIFGLIKGDGKAVDHKDRNRTNNKKENLRLCSQRENTFNSSKRKNSLQKFKGVTFRNNSYNVSLSKDGNRYNIGKYFDEISAARAYDKYAEILFGEFAALNFPLGHEMYCKNDMDLYNKDFNKKLKNKTSKYRGVSMQKNVEKWVVKCGATNKRRSFNDEKEAALYYNKLALEKYGNKAKLNIIEENNE
jgi:hypothetical protein